MKHTLAYEQIENAFQTGTFSTNEALKIGINKQMLKTLLDKGYIRKIDRSIYVLSNVWEDNEYVFQKKYKKGVISHLSALHILGYIKDNPDGIYVTFECGYNCESLKDRNVHITRVNKKNYEIGIIDVLSYSGNTIKAYNIERTICDILRGNKYDYSLISVVIKKYLQSKNVNLSLLYEYGEIFKVNKKMKMITDIISYEN